jgi:SAM-dependent methyltransferase
VYAEEEVASDLRLSDADKARYANPPAETIFTKEYYYHLLAPLRGKKVLEIACGSGLDTCLAAYFGAEVYAYDVSPAAVHLARKRAEVNGVSDRVHLQVSGDLAQAFAGEQFDAVAGYAAIHHIPLEGLAETIHARLRPGGLAVFTEPVINSRLLERARRMIPCRPVEITEDEQPLNDRTVAELAKPFSRIQRRQFECLSRAYRVLPHSRTLVRGLYRLDWWLMKLPPLRRFASVEVFALYRDT